MKKIRELKAREIDCRVGTCKKNGFSILLYKNARVDMDLLDEVYGAENWQREHIEIKGHLFCRVSVWTGAQWVVKEDVGVESNAEATKGEASDSFKRACVNIGIGRELYTAPFIWINPVQGEIKEHNGKFKTYTKLIVSEIAYNDDREISHLVLIDDNNRERYRLSSPGDILPPPVNVESNPFNQAPKEDKRDIAKVKEQIGVYGKSPALTPEEKEMYKIKYRNCKNYDDFMSLCVDMELRLEAIK